MVPVGFVVVFGLCLMAPKAKLTAALFQERYGDLVSREHADGATAYTLRVALGKRTPPIVVSDGLLKLSAYSSWGAAGQKRGGTPKYLRRMAA